MRGSLPVCCTVFGIGGGILGGRAGTRLGKRLSARAGALNTVFAALLLVVAACMLFRSAVALGLVGWTHGAAARVAQEPCSPRSPARSPRHVRGASSAKGVPSLVRRAWMAARISAGFHSVPCITAAHSRLSATLWSRA